MDIVMVEVMGYVGWLLPLVWIAFVGCWVAALWLTRQRRQISADRVMKIVSVLVVTYLASVFVSWWILDHYTHKRLETFAHGRIHSLNITFEGRKTEIRDPTLIGEFWSIICSSRKVWGHHSGPVEVITLFLPELGFKYSLGKDSKVADEFWLMWVSYRGSISNSSYMTVAKHFRSPVLSDWLRRNVLVSLERKNGEKLR